MTNAFKTFLTKMIDYTGLFPPAKLPFEAALPNYLAFQQTENQWLARSFICPTHQLAMLTDQLANFESPEPIWVTILGSGGDTAKTFMQNLLLDLDKISKFLSPSQSKAVLDKFEVKLPDSLSENEDPGLVTAFLKRVAAQFELSDLPGTRLFFEPTLNDEWIGILPAIIEGIHDFNMELDSHSARVGFKLRCGDPCPASDLVAVVIHHCAEQKVPFKTTAGAHHPLHQSSDEGDTHGFLNLFGAAMIAWNQHLTIRSTKKIIEDESIESFVFDDTIFRWGDYGVATEQIESARQEGCFSFGCSSFDEPMNGLKQLNLLD